MVKKGEIPWNKGKKYKLKTLRTKESREKQSQSMLGKVPWNKGKKGLQVAWNKGKKCPQLSGENHGMYGKSHSKETKDNWSEKRKGIKYTEERKKKMSGENHPNWKGGKSFKPYCPKFNTKKKEEIRNQYDRKCYLCKKDEKDNITKNGKARKLCVHHIDEDKEQGCNGKQWKLVPLCINCHGKIHNKKGF